MAMQFTRLPGGSHNDSKAAKFVLVAGLHVALGALFIHSINTKKISLPSLPDALQVKVEPERPSPPPPPPEPPTPMPKIAPPDLVIPKPIIDVAPPPTPAPPATFVEPDPFPFPATPSAAPPEAPATPGTNSGNPGQMHTAVFADANGCALPDYPAAAARRGDSGTTTLALLVGTDGRVSSARVEHSSGSRDLDRAAINALSLCRFKPATSNGLAEAGWAKLAYVWKLD
jgi:protein TonB